MAALGSAFLSADPGITPEPREDHAAYIANWLKVLKDDKRTIFTAAAHAERAAGFLHGLQPDVRMKEVVYTTFLVADAQDKRLGWGKIGRLFGK